LKLDTHEQVEIPIRNIRGFDLNLSQQKKVIIITEDSSAFLFMDFLRYDKARQNLEAALICGNDKVCEANEADLQIRQGLCWLSYEAKRKGSYIAQVFLKVTIHKALRYLFWIALEVKSWNVLGDIHAEGFLWEIICSRSFLNCFRPISYKKKVWIFPSIENSISLLIYFFMKYFFLNS